ncbi:MAG: YgaP family membrane protein [Bacillota bacterium]
MKKNVGTVDRNFRLTLGVVFLILGYFINSFFYVVAGISFFTALFRFCGFYKLFGINTCNTKDVNEKL